MLWGFRGGGSTSGGVYWRRSLMWTWPWGDLRMQTGQECTEAESNVHPGAPISHCSRELQCQIMSPGFFGRKVHQYTYLFISYLVEDLTTESVRQDMWVTERPIRAVIAASLAPGCRAVTCRCAGFALYSCSHLWELSHHVGDWLGVRRLQKFGRIYYTLCFIFAFCSPCRRL